MSGRVGTVALLTLVCVALAVGASACAPEGPARDSSETSSVEASPTAEPVDTGPPTPSAPATLSPQLSAAENLAFFDAVNLDVISVNDEAGGRNFVDALAAAGFDKTQMQVTADRTTVDLAADSVQFAVLFQGECLVGQYGPASGGYHSAVRPALGTGGCLVGQTRPIDW
ncbi:MAG TPA: hypothetical protein VFR16_14415 [Agromyces mariniharenae]|nr:hypothetical protein [Agromyces mariniharenae]